MSIITSTLNSTITFPHCILVISIQYPLQLGYFLLRLLPLTTLLLLGLLLIGLLGMLMGMLMVHQCGHGLVNGLGHLQSVLFLLVHLHYEVVVLVNELVEGVGAVEAKVRNRVLLGGAEDGVVADGEGAQTDAGGGLAGDGHGLAL